MLVQEHYLEFVDVLKLHTGTLGRAGHPIHHAPLGQRQGAIGFYLHGHAMAMQQIHQRGGELQKGLTTGQHHVVGRIGAYLAHNVFFSHDAVPLMLCITKSALHIAS